MTAGASCVRIEEANLMVCVVLIRHGEKDDQLLNEPLTVGGRKASQSLGKFLREIKISPDLILTSKYQHARETAQEIARETAPQIEPLPIEGLTPGSDEKLFSVAAILEAATQNGREIGVDSTLFIVGHEPRLTQLVSKMTRKRLPPFERVGAVCIRAGRLDELKYGSGKVQWWYPVTARDDELGDKLTGKMTVATFLAGFNFTALIELIKEPGGLLLENDSRWCKVLDRIGHPQEAPCPSEELDWLGFTAVAFLTVSLGLFITAVFVYDRLSMPGGYLENPPLPWLLGGKRRVIRDRMERFGYVYAAMIHAWHAIFMPAVGFFLAGLLVVAARIKSPWPWAGMTALLLFVWIYHHLQRPRYAID
jgi:phosphohistidine phosphatase SixA